MAVSKTSWFTENRVATTIFVAMSIGSCVASKELKAESGVRVKIPA